MGKSRRITAKAVTGDSKKSRSLTRQRRGRGMTRLLNFPQPVKAGARPTRLVGIGDLELGFGNAGAGTADDGGEPASEFADAIRFVQEHGFAWD
jgi:hypothetical protein